LRKRGGVRFLTFHEILDHQVEPFIKLLHFIRNNYSIITPADYQRAIYSRKPCFIISFDDGFRSQLKITNEVLDPLGVKALFFVCPAFVRLKRDETLGFIRNNFGRKDIQELSPAYEPIDWEGLRDLSGNGHIIGCHTMNHARLSTLTSDVDLKAEIVNAGKEISDQLECEICWFAYPLGDVESISQRAMKIIGEKYIYCCSGLSGINTQSTKLLCISRQPLDLDKPFNFSVNVALGAFDIAYMLKHIKLTRMAQ
jgi:peptidoglycan/xylan/chitin deacetylase (PgdA/CDA1 family)